MYIKQCPSPTHVYQIMPISYSCHFQSKHPIPQKFHPLLDVSLLPVIRGICPLCLK